MAPGAVSAGFSGGQLSSLQGGIAFGSSDIFFMGAAPARQTQPFTRFGGDEK
jgi:hypothetical protein